VSPGLRKFRAAVYFYSASTTGGITTSTRTRQLSGDEDGLWWVSRGTPTGNEPTVGMKPEERMDSILGLLAEVPVNRDSVIVLDGESVQYRVLTVLPRDYGRDEHQCPCQVVPADTYTLTEPAP
jgi:hypothetical protein